MKCPVCFKKYSKRHKEFTKISLGAHLVSRHGIKVLAPVWLMTTDVVCPVCGAEGGRSGKKFTRMGLCWHIDNKHGIRDARYRYWGDRIPIKERGQKVDKGQNWRETGVENLSHHSQ